MAAGTPAASSAPSAPRPPVKLPDRGRQVPWSLGTREERVGGSETAHARQAARVGIADDDAPAAGLGGDGRGIAAQPSGALHEDVLQPLETGCLPAGHRRGQRAVGGRRHLVGHIVGEAHDAGSGGNQTELGEAGAQVGRAVAGVVPVLAQAAALRGQAGRAVVAPAATAGDGPGDAVARVERTVAHVVGDPLAESGDAADDLVSEDDRQRRRPAPAPGVQIGLADGAASDPDQHLSRPGSGHGIAAQLQRAPSPS